MLPTPPARATPRPSPTPDWSRSPAPPETVVVDGVSWQRLYADSLPPVDGLVLDGSSGGQLLAEGAVSYCPTYCVSSDWYLLTSPDGILWSVLGQLPGEPNDISTVFDSDFGYFAGGTIGQGGGIGPAGIWRSTDGANWSLADEDTPQPGVCASAKRDEIMEFYSTDKGLVASGTASWLSNDGKHWRCVTDQLLFNVVGGDNEFVGAGEDGTLPGDPEAIFQTLWNSNDGVHWSLSRKVPADVDVAAVDRGFFALTEGYPMNAADGLFFTSADGKAWIERAYPFGSHVVEGLVSDGKRAAAVEEGDRMVGTSAPGALWISSPDGTAWTSYQLPKGDGDEVDGEVALMGNTVVVTGDAGDGGTVMWVAQIP